MAECKTKVADVGVVKEWCGTSKEFFSMSVKPGKPPSPSDDPGALAKWIVFQFHAMVIAQIIYLVFVVLSGGTMNIGGLISAVIGAWVQAWVFWFSFVKREPNCCCVLIVTIEGWKYMHLLVGIAFILQGLSYLVNTLLFITSVLGMDIIALVLYLVYSVVILLYAVGMIGTGMCMVKIGQKKSGVEIPKAETIGA